MPHSFPTRRSSDLFIILLGAVGGVPSQIRRYQFIHPMLAVSASALARSSARRRLLDAAAVRHARSGAHDPRGRKLDSSAKGRALIPAGGNQGVRSVHLFLPVHFRVIKIVLTTSRSLPGRAFTWGHP